MILILVSVVQCFKKQELIMKDICAPRHVPVDAHMLFKMKKSMEVLAMFLMLPCGATRGIFDDKHRNDAESCPKCLYCDKRLQGAVRYLPASIQAVMPSLMQISTLDSLPEVRYHRLRSRVFRIAQNLALCTLGRGSKSPP